MLVWLRRYWLHALAITPLALTAYEYLTNTLPVVLDRHLMIRFGAVGLAFLVASFACTPLSTLSGNPYFVTQRRTLGVYSFGYIALHLLVYAGLNSQFDWDLIVRDLSERPAMSVGLLAFALLIPLAATSTNGWQKRLGMRWKTLHKLVYIAVPLSLLHYLWLERDILDWAVVYILLVTALFAARLPVLRRVITRVRHGTR